MSAFFVLISHTPLMTIISLVIIGLLFLIGFLIFSCWLEAAMIVVLREGNEKISFKTALGLAKKYILPSCLATVATFCVLF